MYTYLSSCLFKHTYIFSPFFHLNFHSLVSIQYFFFHELLLIFSSNLQMPPTLKTIEITVRILDNFTKAEVIKCKYWQKFLILQKVLKNAKVSSFLLQI